MRIRIKPLAAAGSVVAVLTLALLSPVTPSRLEGLGWFRHSYYCAGEALLHGVARIEPDLSACMPLSGIVEALLVGHRLGDFAIWSAACRAVFFLLLFSLGGLLGGLWAAVAAACLYPWGWQGPEGQAVQFFYAIAILTVAAAAAWRAQKPTLARSAWLSLALAASLLYRSPLVFFPPLLAAIDWRAARRRPWAHAALVGALPYAVLLPWLWLNWRLHHRLIPLERGEADYNIVAGALGIVPGVDGDWRGLIAGPVPDASVPGAVIRWAVGQTLRHPAAYAWSCLLRLGWTLSLHPILAALAGFGAWGLRREPSARPVIALAAYFLAMHCLMSVVSEYFFPLWPVLCALGAAGVIEAAGRAEAGVYPRLFASPLLGALALEACLSAFSVARVLNSAMRADEPVTAAALAGRLAQAPGDAWLPRERARRLLGEGKPALAASDYQRASRLLPEDPLLRVEAAWAQFIGGDPDPILAVAPGNGWFTDRTTLESLQIAAEAARGRPERARARWDQARREAASKPLVRRLERPEELAAQERLAENGLRKFSELLVETASRYRAAKPRARILTKLAEAIGDEPQLWMAAARASLAAGDRRAAAASLNRLKLLSPSSFPGRRADVYAALSLFDDAIGALNPPSRSADESQTGLVGVAASPPRPIAPPLNAHSQARVEIARTLASSALGSRIVSEACTAERAGLRSQAINLLKKLESPRVSADATNCGPLRQAALLYRTMGRHADALRLLKRCEASQVGEAGYWLERAAAEGALASVREAAADLDKANPLAMTCAETRRAAALYESLGEGSQALALLGRCEADFSGEAGYWLERSRVEDGPAGGRKAADLARARAAARTPDERHEIALAYQSLGLYVPALEIFRGLPAGDTPQAARYARDQGICRSLSGDRAGAVSDLERAVRLAPRLLSARLSLATVIAGQGRLKQALKVLDQALAVSHPEPEPGLPALLASGRREIAARLRGAGP